LSSCKPVEPVLTPVEPVLPSSFLVFVEKVSTCLFTPPLGNFHIAPRQLGAVGGQQGRPKLPSIGWCTGQSGAPPDTHCRRYSADLFPFLAQMTVAAPGQMAHRTLSGAHRTVRCPPADRWRGPRVARRLRGRPLRWRSLAHRTVRCTIGQSGEL
jgi:hypothetical protein